MKKMKSIKVASIATGIVIIGMFLIAMPLLGAAKSSDVQSPSVNTVTAEEATVSNDIDDVQDEVVDINEADDVEEANEANKSGDLNEADENLSEGGYEDPAGVETDHQFEGVE
jgi:hypothetical protein